MNGDKTAALEDLAVVAETLAADVAAGKRSAIARAMSELERDSKLARHLLRALGTRITGTTVVGVTGPPGAGKSSLVNALVKHWRAEGLRIGVIAVDPSSPISGGAILGDRIRMTSALNDDGVFVRSLASQGHLGGLSPAAVRMIDVFDVAGFDIIVIETVGAGQSEIDVAEITDIKLVVCAPGLGDDVQAMKSGLLEIADILVVNKGDLGGAEQTLQQLTGAVSIRSGDRAQTPIIKVSATRNDSIEGLTELIVAAGKNLNDTAVGERRRRRVLYIIAHVAVDVLRAHIQTGQADNRIEALACAVLDGELSLEDAGLDLLALVANQNK